MSNSVPLEVMRSVHPHGVTDLLSAARLPEGTVCSVAGVVVDCDTPHKSYKDWFITFTLNDDTSEQLKIRVFHPHRDRLLEPAAGDVVCMKNITMKLWAGRMFGVSNTAVTQWLVFKSDNIPKGSLRMKYASGDNIVQHERSAKASQPTVHEQQWAITLGELYTNGQLRGTGVTQQPHASQQANNPGSQLNPYSKVKSNRPMKFSLIKDILVNKFYDITCEVVKKFWNNDFVELYVTDYTENNMLEYKQRHDIGDMDANRGPHGKMTLRVDLFPPHAAHADQNICEGELVFLQNVRIKHNRNGQNLEGSIWHDPKYQTKVCVWAAREQDPGVEDLKNRRDKYWSREQGQSTGKSKKSQNRKKAKLNTAVDPAVQSDVGSLQDAETKQDDSVASPSKFNPNVVVLGGESSLVTLNEVVHHPKRKGVIGNSLKFDFPCINARYRTSLRIVDFFPHDICGFAQPDMLEASSSSKSLQMMKWHFWLVCESGEPENENQPDLKINLLVEGAQALRLLGSDFDPTAWNNKLRRDRGQATRALSERLFLLWGELEEQKRQFLSKNTQIKADETFSLVSHGIKCHNYPFVCDVGEIGLKAPGTDAQEGEDPRMGYQRLYILLDTALS